MAAGSLHALRGVLPGALIALDYDGTLAPVRADPARTRPLDGVVEVLAALAPQVGRLAVVTGRPALFVTGVGGLAAVPGLVVLGQYGAERWQAGELTVRPALPGVTRARLALADLPAGAVLEDKGSALAVHTRQAADPAGLLAALGPRLERLAAATGLACHPGRFVLELRPVGDDKGRALRALLDPLPSGVLYAGDDLGDLTAFAVLARLAGLPVLRVCSDSAEAPEPLRAQADLTVGGPPGVLALLRSLLH